MILDHFPDNTIKLGSVSYLYFGGTAYLGMATHSGFKENLVIALKKWGTFYGSSRNSNVKLGIFNRFEDYFARFIGADKVLSVSSGTLAGKLVVDYFGDRNYRFFHFPKTHPAIVAPKSTPVVVAGKLDKELLSDKAEKIVITADAIESGMVNPTNFDILKNINPKKQITLLLDESHAIGVLGKNGSGIFSSLDLQNVNNIVVASSLSKAFSLSGGIIGGSCEFIDTLKEQSTFTSSSPANAAYLEAFLQSENFYREQRKKLFKNLTYIKNNLDNKSVTFNKNYPVLYFDDDAIFDKLADADIIISRFKYPTYKKTMNRIVITANHTRKDLNKLLNVLNS
ncbi:MAG: aminotransferase class I/II [Flavobacteriales bacterium]|nr:MAG: aminotransferase class I/II [Flavobacteriales bacterium]